MEGELKEVRRG